MNCCVVDQQLSLESEKKVISLLFQYFFQWTHTVGHCSSKFLRAFWSFWHALSVLCLCVCVCEGGGGGGEGGSSFPVFFYVRGSSAPLCLPLFQRQEALKGAGTCRSLSALSVTVRGKSFSNVTFVSLLFWRFSLFYTWSSLSSSVYQCVCVCFPPSNNVCLFFLILILHALCCVTKSF